jgi:F-type H+-transporting ATPase subunit b
MQLNKYKIIIIYNGKVNNQFEFGLFFWQILIFVGLILLLKNLLILDAVKRRRRNQKTR